MVASEGDHLEGIEESSCKISAAPNLSQRLQDLSTNPQRWPNLPTIHLTIRLGMDCELYRLFQNTSNGTLSDGVTAGNRDNETLLLMRHQPVDGYQAHKPENNDQESLLNSWSVPYDLYAGSVWTHYHSPLPLYNAAQPHISSRHVPDDMSAGDSYNGCKSSLVCSLLVRLPLNQNLSENHVGGNANSHMTGVPKGGAQFTLRQICEWRY